MPKPILTFEAYDDFLACAGKLLSLSYISQIPSFPLHSSLPFSFLFLSFSLSLPLPSLTPPSYPLAIESEEEKVNQLRFLVSQIPIENQELLHKTLLFIIEVSKYSEENQMHLANLATMFGPTFLRKKEQERAALLQDLQSVIAVTLTMLSYPMFEVGISLSLSLSLSLFSLTLSLCPFSPSPRLLTSFILPFSRTGPTTRTVTLPVSKTTPTP